MKTSDEIEAKGLDKKAMATFNDTVAEKIAKDEHILALPRNPKFCENIQQSIKRKDPGYKASGNVAEQVQTLLNRLQTEKGKTFIQRKMAKCGK